MPLTSISITGGGAVPGSGPKPLPGGPWRPISPFRIKTERQHNNCDGLIPISRASAEMFAPASQLRAAISALKASNQRRRPAIGAPSTCAEQVEQFLREAELDGLMLIFPDYVEGLTVFGNEMLPGLRAAFA